MEIIKHPNKHRAYEKGTLTLKDVNTNRTKYRYFWQDNTYMEINAKRKRDCLHDTYTTKQHVKVSSISALDQSTADMGGGTEDAKSW